MSATTFASVTAVTAVAPGRFEALLDPRWTIGGKPNGGYLLAVLARAAVEGGEHDHVVAAGAQYLHAPDPGPASIWVEPLRTGRTASQVRARLSQDDRICVEALFTTSHLDAGTAPYWSGGAPARPRTTFGDAAPVEPRSPAGFEVPLLGEVEVRMDRDSKGWLRGQPTGAGELRGWLSLPEGADFDPLSLLFAVDAFPPATFDVQLTGWVPTLAFTVYVRGLPAPGPVQVVQRAGLIEAQRVDEHCWVWDADGRVVAHGMQLAGIRLG